jgi:hypothetical protein
MKAITGSDLISITRSGAKLIAFGPKRRWRLYPA